MPFKIPGFKFTEPLFFSVFIVINSSILVVSKHFPTLDGPAHLYNATIIRELLFDKESIYHHFFSLNPEFPPNTLSYIFLTGLKSILPYFLPEKILILLHLVFSPLLFRQLIKLYNKDNFLLSYLIFPFTHFSLLYMGFYNFTLGLVFSLLCLRIYLSQEKKFDAKKFILLFAGFGLLYFSHIFVFIITILCMLIHSAHEFLVEVPKLKTEILNWLKAKIILVFLPAVLFIILCIAYLINRPGQYNLKFLPTETITWFYTNAASLQAYGTKENLYCKIIALGLLLLTIITLFSKFSEIYRTKSFKKLFLKQDAFGWISLVLILLSYTLPNEDGYGGFITDRLVLFVFVFLILWLATYTITPKAVIPVIAIILICHLALLNTKSKVIRNLSHAVSEIEKTIPFLKENSSVITFTDYDTVWQFRHFGNYLAAEMPVMLFENYEADTGYFPVVWKDGLPAVRIGNSLSGKAICWTSGRDENRRIAADYIFAFNIGNNACYNANYPAILKDYKLIYRNSLVMLYALNPNENQTEK